MEKRHDTLEVYEMARELGVDLDRDELEAAFGTKEHEEAVARCEKCGNFGECHLFMQGGTSAANNKQWWLKEFCPNAELLLRMSDERRGFA